MPAKTHPPKQPPAKLPQALYAAFEEEKHPRAEGGEFSSGGGSQGRAASSLDVPASEHNRAIHKALGQHPGHEFSIAQLRHLSNQHGNFGGTEGERLKNFHKELGRMVQKKEVEYTPRGNYRHIATQAPYLELPGAKQPTAPSLPGQKGLFGDAPAAPKPKIPPPGPAARKPQKSLFSRIGEALARYMRG
jgi:hypothetical protein